MKLLRIRKKGKEIPAALDNLGKQNIKVIAE